MLSPSKLTSMPFFVAFASTTLVFRCTASRASQALGQRLDQVGVGAGHQLVHELDHGDFAAERGVHGGHLQADDAAADDQQLLRHVAQLQRVGGIHHARVVPREGRQLHRLRAGGDDRMLEADQLLPSVVCDFHFVRRHEDAGAVHRAHLALLRHAGQTAGQLADDLVLERAQLVEVDLRRAEVTPWAAIARPRRSPRRRAAAPWTECSRR